MLVVRLAGSVSLGGRGRCRRRWGSMARPRHGLPGLRSAHCPCILTGPSSGVGVASSSRCTWPAWRSACSLVGRVWAANLHLAAELTSGSRASFPFIPLVLLLWVARACAGRRCIDGSIPHYPVLASTLTAQGSSRRHRHGSPAPRQQCFYSPGLGCIAGGRAPRAVGWVHRSYSPAWFTLCMARRHAPRLTVSRPGSGGVVQGPRPRSALGCVCGSGSRARRCRSAAWSTAWLARTRSALGSTRRSIGCSGLCGLG